MKGNLNLIQFVLAIMLLPLGVRVEAQQAGKVFRIGYLDASTASGSAALVDAFRQELSKLGWIEGKNISIEYRFAEQKVERLPELAADLVRFRVDVIVAGSTASALAAKSATSVIPVVIASGGDPIGAGLIASLAQPGGNVTGLSSMNAELNTKRLEILKDVIPRLSRVGIVRQLAGVGADIQMKELGPAALALKLKLEEIKSAPDTNALEGAFQSAKYKEVNAIMVTAARAFLAERKHIVELARKYRLPTIYVQKEFVDEGGLMSYGTDYGHLFRRAAHYVDKVLKGVKPSELPVAQSTKFEFIVNLKAAKQIGLTIPVRVLERANQVIK